MTPRSPANVIPGLDLAKVSSLLDEIGDPCSVANGTPMGLAEMGLIDDISCDAEGRVLVRLRLTSPSCYMLGYFATEIRSRLLKVAGVSEVQVTSDLGLDWTPEMMTAAAKERRRQSLALRGLTARVGQADPESPRSTVAPSVTVQKARPKQAESAAVGRSRAARCGP